MSAIGDFEHFDNLKMPLCPNDTEVSIYQKYIVGRNNLLLGYTKQLIHLCNNTMDLNFPPSIIDRSISICDSNTKFINQDWYTINTKYDTIIGDGVINLVGGQLVDHLAKYCNILIIRFFTKKITGMKYATYFENNTIFPTPNIIIDTFESCKILVWNFLPKVQIKFDSIDKLVHYLDKSQYLVFDKSVINKDIMTKQQLQKKTIGQELEKNLYKGQAISCTSGSTGIPVIVPKTPESTMWHLATNIRDLKWRKWDLSKKRVAILARFGSDVVHNNVYLKKLDTIVNLQLYLNKIQPNYLFTYPSIVQMLDLSVLTELIDVRSVGENGATSYSCEEVGTIALQCPDYPEIYHIMENIIVEIDPIHGVLITDLSNNFIQKYAIGDVVELGKELCKCGRKLPTITKIYGRIRNMMILPNGDKIWPTIGEPLLRTVTDKILQHQAVQKSLYEIDLCLKVSLKLTSGEEDDLILLAKKILNQSHIIFKIVYVNSFPMGKFEAFKCLI